MQLQSIYCNNFVIIFASFLDVSDEIFYTIQMNLNISYSQSLKKFVYKSNPLQIQVDRFFQRSYSHHRNSSEHRLPSMQTRPYSKQHSNHIKVQAASTSKFSRSEDVNDEKGELLRETNVTNSSNTNLIPRYKQANQGRRSNMAQEVDNIMNAVIGAHSPHLERNDVIKRSISTKKFKNVRVVTEVNQKKVKSSKHTGLIKQIIDFMVKNSKCNHKNKKKQQKEDEQCLDLSHFSPYKLLKKSQDLLAMHPLHKFKRQEQEYLNQPLNSQNYIKQLRTGKMFVKDVNLKRY